MSKFISVLYLYLYLFQVFSTFSDTIKYFPYTMTNHSSTLRLLLIADSVDRNAVQDWCVSNEATLCHVHGECDVDNIFEGNRTFHSFFSQSVSSKGAVQVCYSHNLNIIVSFLFNTNGVMPRPYCDSYNQNPDEVVGAHDLLQSSSMETFLNYSLAPNIRALKFLMGGYPHGLLIQSSLWDVQRLQHCESWRGIRNDYPRSKKQPILSNWQKEWAENASLFVNTLVKTYYYDSNSSSATYSYLAWRTNHEIPLVTHPVNNSKWYGPHFATKDGQALMAWMREGGKDVVIQSSSATGIRVLPFHLFPNVRQPRHRRYDIFHPSIDTSKVLIDVLINNTRNSLKRNTVII